MQAVFSAEDIARAVDRLADDIAQNASGITHCAVLMDGAMIFASDLLRALYKRGIDPITLSFRLSSYGKARQSSGRVRVTADIEGDVTGAHVLIVDDVLDSGATLDFAKAHIEALGAATVTTCVFADKPYPGRTLTADFIGVTAPDKFLIGYGLDDAARKRGLPEIWAAG